jgi:hypothetical protein
VVSEVSPASILRADFVGYNRRFLSDAKQVQHWLGHHSPTFTLDRYGHLMDEGVVCALDVTAELESVARCNSHATHPTQIDPTTPETVLAEMAS